MNIYYVYLLIDPRNNKPFYVGYGHGNRMYEHVQEAKRSKHRNLKLNKIRKIQSEGHDIIYNKILENISALEAKNKEIELIKHYGRFDLGTGILCNHTNGGDGVIELSKEIREKMGEKQRLKKMPEDAKKKISDANQGPRNPFYGKKHSDVTKQKMKDSNNANIGEEHHNHGVSLKDQIIRKHGEEEGDQKYQEYCENQSRFLKKYYKKLKDTGVKRKSAYQIWTERYGKEEADRKLKESQEKHEITRKKNGKKKLSNYDNDLLKFGKEIADEKELERRKKISSNENVKKSNFSHWVDKYGLESANLLQKQMIEKMKLTKQRLSIFHKHIENNSTTDSNAIA